MQQFRQTRNTVLIGTDSFWEGIDVPGDALTCVIIAKLPFKSPSDPIFAARCREIPNAFNNYSIPIAITKTRQGFGRLMRSAQDYGTVIVLDPRVTRQAYGRKFLKSLPTCPTVDDSTHAVLTQALAWINSHQPPTPVDA